jgi:hypothetical protein
LEGFSKEKESGIWSKSRSKKVEQQKSNEKSVHSLEAIRIEESPETVVNLRKVNSEVDER